MAVTVRRIRSDEALQLREIRLAALADTPSAFARTHAEEAGLPFSHWSDRAATAAAGRSSAMFFAELDTESAAPVGLVGAYRERVEQPHVELVSMWVAPAGRRCGTGRLLVQAVLDWAHETGADAVELSVTVGNVAAQHLYERMGFESDGGYQPLPSDPCRNELRMRRPTP